MNSVSPAILLIDDSAQDAELVELALGRSGVRHQFHWVPGVDQAIVFLGEGGTPRPALVLLDIQMPRRNGFEFLKWVRSRTDDLRLLPIAMLTTSHDSIEIRRAYQEGANSFLVKPTGFEELCGILKDAGAFWLHRNRLVT